MSDSCNPMDCSLPGSSVHEIFQARIKLEWVAVSFSKGSSRPRDWTCVSRVSCIGRQILYHLSPQGSPIHTLWVLTRSQQHAREKPGPSTCIAHWAKNMSQTQVRKNHITRMCSDLEMQGRHLKDIDLMGRLAHGEQCEGESSSGAASPRGIM